MAVLVDWDGGAGEAVEDEQWGREIDGEVDDSVLEGKQVV